MPIATKSASAATALLALLAAGVPAHAAEVTQSQVILSADNCQAALPVFDGNIRKRPLAMANEGSAPVFITCAFKGLWIDPHSAGNNLLGIALGATGSQPMPVTCTLVNGIDAPVYVARTRNVTPGIANLLFWQPSDFGLAAGEGIDLAALSCALPPQASVLYTLRSYVEQIAN